MTTLHETAYPSLKPDPTPRELAELYTPTKDEQLLAAGIGKRAFLPLQILRFGAYSHVDAGNLDRRGRAGRFSLCRHGMAFLGIRK